MAISASPNGEMATILLIGLWVLTCAPIISVYYWATVASGKSGTREGQRGKHYDGDVESEVSTPGMSRASTSEEEEPFCIQLTPLKAEAILKVRQMVQMNKRFDRQLS
mmetsp:Transcript_107055/g.297727  ORF Transcript_107055/g.297727 Transcript_107055/m.297727 type:complete len:108 (-) Transcript_107055:29-352(-)